MQRVLHHDLAPPGEVPLRFLLAAPWFGALAGLLLLAAGPAALESRWSPALLAIAHLLTLGCLGLAMIGAGFQLVPAVAGLIVRLPPALLCATWVGIMLGAVCLAAAFLLAAGWLFVGAAALLSPALAIPGLALLAALARPCAPGALPMVRGMRLAFAALLATAGLGVAMALYLAGLWPAPLLLLVDLHALWGLLGWVALLVACVGFQVIPMFLQTRIYPDAATRQGVWLFMVLLLGWSALRVLAPGAAGWPGALLALLLAAFALGTLRMLARRRRQPVDATNRYWFLSLASLAACCALYAAGGPPLALGVLFIAGFALGALNGMLYKIVPFLLWYALQRDAGVGANIPKMRELAPPERALWQFRAHLAALGLLLAALYWPALARAAGLAFMAAQLMLARDLARAVRLCRRARRTL